MVKSMEKQIITVTLNPCIDRTINVETFDIGMTNFVKSCKEEIAGKGINVAIAVSHLRIPVKNIGFAYENDYDRLVDKLEYEKISY